MDDMTGPQKCSQNISIASVCGFHNQAFKEIKEKGNYIWEKTEI